MFTGKQWGTVLRFWADGVTNAYDNYLTGEGDDRRQRLEETVGPTIHGGSIVMVVSLAERLVLDCLRSVVPKAGQVRLADPGWRGQLGLQATWDGWDLLEGMVALRHCFAHEYGRVTDRQLPLLGRFRARLRGGHVKITMLNQARGGGDKTEQVREFFDVDAQKTVLLRRAPTSQALRVLGIGLLRQLEKAGHLKV